MPRKLSKPTIEDELAIFTDLLMEGDREVDLLLSDDVELGELENTVRFMVDALCEPQARTSQEQIRNELIAEWQSALPRRKVRPSEGQMQVDAPAGGWGRRWVPFAFALIVLGLAVGLFSGFPGLIPEFLALIEENVLIPAAVLVCAVLGGLLFTSLHKSS